MLTKIKKIDRLFSVNTEAANYLFNKILDNYKKKSIKPTISKNTILKNLSYLYTEKIKNYSKSQNPFYILTYDLYLNKYGLKKVAENKYVQVF